MRRFFTLPLVLCLCLGFACQKQGKEATARLNARADTDAAAIRALVGEWVRLYNAADSDRLLSVFYADDAVMISPTAVHRGRSAILLSFRKDARENDEHVDTSVVEELRVSGDLAVARGVDTGTTGPRGTARPATYRVNWVMAFARQSDGAWKCIDEMWNDAPKPGTSEKP